MEGRLMLAVSPIGAPQGKVATTQVWTLAQPNLTGLQILTSDAQADGGGFANALPPDLLSTGTTYSLTSSPAGLIDASSDSFVIYRSASTWSTVTLVGSIAPTSAISFGTSGDYLIPSPADKFADDAGLSIHSLYDGPTHTSPIDLTPLQPAVIPSEAHTSDNGSLSPFDMKPVVIGPSPSQPGPGLPGEGGSIPIHAIFADFRQDGHLASGVKSVSSLLTEASIDLQASVHTTSTSDDAIAGEWARATVFEIAGGEPGDLTSLGEKNNASGKGDALQNDPLSTIERPHRSNGRRAAKSSQADATDGQVGQQTQPEDAVVADNSTNPADPTGQTAADDLAASTALGDSIQLAAADPTGTANPEAAAVEAVFRRLGEDKNAVVESNLHGKSWLRSICASPLLMALALERLAALNSRRARREAKTSPAKVSQRL
jgi:hypothetical protein